MEVRELPASLQLKVEKYKYAFPLSNWDNDLQSLNSFAWDKTEEGRIFWSDLHYNDLSDIKDDPRYSEYFKSSINNHYSIY